MEFLALLLAAVEPTVADVAPVWTWRETLAALAIVFSAGALVISWVAYRQRVRYHPQPKMMLEWSERLDPDSGLFFRRAYIINRGDAVARHVIVNVAPSQTTPWTVIEAIEPGQSERLSIPVVDGVSWKQEAIGISYGRSGTPESYKFVTPVVSVSWIQVPLDGKPKVRKWTAPKTPDMRSGETT